MDGVEDDRIDAATEAAWVAALDEYERGEAKKKEAAEKEYWAAESLRIASTYGLRNKEADKYKRIVTEDGKTSWVVLSKPKRTKAKQAGREGRIDKDKPRLRQVTFTEIRKKAAAAQKLKDDRARRFAHHGNYLARLLEEEKAIVQARLSVTPEEYKRIEEERIAEKKANALKLAGLIKARDELVEREKKRLAIKKIKDAQMRRAVLHRKALESIARREKKRGDKKKKKTIKDNGTTIEVIHS